MSEVVAGKILEEAQARGAELLTASELLHLGTRAAVDQALSRLTRRGELVRVSRGLYARPVQGRFGQVLPPTTKVAEAVAKRLGEPLVRHGAAAANRLGLTTQVPVREVYLTSGATQQIRVGRQRLELRHAPSWQLIFPRSAAGELLRAMAWLGPVQAQRAAEQIRAVVPRAELEQLLEVRSVLPTWMAQQVSTLAHAG